MSSSLLDSLNHQQRKAVTYPAKPALILAGAGTGKTRVLTTRIAYLLEQRLADVQGILAVTFTNKAAREMSQRISNSFSEMSFTPRAMWLGTFHGLCNRFLRLHYEAAKLRHDFAIIDQDDQFEVINNVMRSKNISAYLQDRVKRFGIRQEITVPDAQKYINKHKERGVRANDVEIPQIDKTGYFLALSYIYKAYEEKLKSLGVVDFAELILRTCEVLREEKEIRQQYQDRFKHILVDEFQDTNRMEYELIKLLSAVDYPSQRTNAVFAVGDDDQAIYSFRGASVENMWQYQEDFDISDPELIRLEQNYRSTGRILRAANSLIAHNKERFEKNLWTDVGEGKKVEIIDTGDQTTEAGVVVMRIKELVKSGEKLKEIAVLYRSNKQSWAIEDALKGEKIKYTISGGQRFYERKEIKSCLAYLQLAENPHNDFAFMNALNVPSRRIGKIETDHLESIALKDRCSLFTAAQKEIEENEETNLKGFVDIIKDLLVKKEELHLPELVSYTIERSGLKKFYEKPVRPGSEDDENSSEEMDYLNELVSASAAFLEHEQIKDDHKEENFDNLTPLAQFLAQATLEPGENQADADKDTVQLMSIHASKGLEFNTVFIIEVVEGSIPNHYSEIEDKIPEERRLMYVAITRAKTNLFILHPRKKDGYSFFDLSPSRFIIELSPVSVKVPIPEGQRDEAAYYDWQKKFAEQMRTGIEGILSSSTPSKNGKSKIKLK